MLQSIYESSGEMPPALSKKPELDTYENWLYAKFWELGRDRRYTEGQPLPITLQEVIAFSKVFHIPDLSTFIHFIRVLDNFYLTEVTKKHKKEMDKVSKTSKAK